jgi:lipoate-protein ligase B
VPLAIDWIGSVPYGDALALQEEALAARRAGSAPDRLLLLEHPPVVTLGRSAREENLRVSREELARRGIALFEVARGGDVTFHAPGQLVGYLIADLADGGRPDVHAHLRRIEAALRKALAALGVASRVVPGRTGVFVDDPSSPVPRKIASIGVGVRGWVSWHGFALDVDMDLSGFDVIVPCGLDDVEMTSLARELGAAAGEDLAARARAAVAAAFAAAWA